MTFLVEKVKHSESDFKIHVSLVNYNLWNWGVTKIQSHSYFKCMYSTDFMALNDSAFNEVSQLCRLQQVSVLYNCI